MSQFQALLQRLARLVAEGTRPETVFAAVTHEALSHSGGDAARMIRFETDGTATLLAGKGIRRHYPSRLTADIRSTGRPSRIDDYIGVPIHIHGRLWGLIAIGSASVRQPDAERRMTAFAEIVTIAIADAQSRADLMASRARIVAAADEARRQIERDLHDGAQQRLVGVALRLRTAAKRTQCSESMRQEIAGLVEEVLGVTADLREICHGIHPAVLSQAGLGPALRVLARRSAVPVRTEIRIVGRLPKPVEACAYYSVAEILTNTVKHASASLATLSAVADSEALRICVSDDGTGGADPARGSGLIGIRDRVEALGGTASVSSVLHTGTRICLQLPVGTDQPPAAIAFSSVIDSRMKCGS